MLNAVIEVGTGLILVYSLLSLVCSGVNELVAAALRLRARNLAKGVTNMVGPDMAAAVYAHPLVDALSKPGQKPSYLPASKFSLALLDRAAPSSVRLGSEPVGADQVTAELAQVPDARVRASLQALWDNARHEVIGFRDEVEAWFNQTMERVAGWYKRTSQAILLVLGLAVAVALNVDTVGLSQRLWSDGPLRTAVLAQAQKVTPPPAASPDQSVGEAFGTVQKRLDAVEALKLPLGWAKGRWPPHWWPALAGWLLTAVAVSLGAPFWFDLLGKVAGLRATGPPEPTTPPSPTPARAASQ